MDIVVSPVSVTFNAQSGGNGPALQAGQIVDALVLRLIDARAQLSIANMVIEVQTQVPLVAGTTVQLAVKSTPEGLKLVLLRDGEGRHPVPGSPVAPAVRGSAAPASSAVAEPLPAPASSATPSAALQTAVRAAAARQDGLAPLMADAAVAQNLAGLPAPVREAASRLLEFRVPLQPDLGADEVRRALLRSGLFLETRLAASGAAATGPTPDLKAALLVFRQVLFAWLGEGDTMPVPGAKTSPLPAAAPAPLESPVATRAGASSPIPAGHPPAANLSMPPGPPSAPAAPTTAGAQSLYRAVAQAFAPAEQGLPVTPGALPGADASAAAKILDQPASRAHLAVALARRPPPPYRGAAPSAQPTADAALSAEPREAARLLLAETDAALARHTLLQAASLPDRADPAAHADPANPRWTFEVPFATPRGAAIAQFEIARDGHGRSAETTPVWRARFSLDVEPMGAVHAEIALVGARASVTLWADRDEAALRLRTGAPLLADALRAAAIEPGEVSVRGGPRPREPRPAGRFLDRAS